MGILVAAAALFLGFGAAYVASDDVRYLTRAGIEQTRILKERRPLEELIGDPAVPPADRDYINLVLAVRQHAADLGLEAKETYTTYTDVGRDTLLLSLTGSRKDCICPVTWKYPVVGRVPYKGFFDPAMARKAADQLAAKGFDVSLRPAAAYSTLGWFNDPLLSTAMIRDSVELASLVFHEIAHNTLYVKSATAFNESFAQLAGYRATEEFFRGRGDSLLADRARDRWLDEIVIGEYYKALIDTLKTFYATKPDSAALDAGRTAIGAWSRAQLEGPFGARFRTFRVARLAARPINNAQLVGVLLYRTHLDWFERWFEHEGSDVRRAVAGLVQLMEGAEGDAAFERLGAAVGGAAQDSAAAHH
ncbi:MAG: aminopeptidase [Gemmatimonadales bacterium]